MRRAEGPCRRSQLLDQDSGMLRLEMFTYSGSGSPGAGLWSGGGYIALGLINTAIPCM